IFVCPPSVFELRLSSVSSYQASVFVIVISSLPIMYIIRSNAKVRENSESAKNEGVRKEKKGGAFQWLMVNG
ncbi:MAG: hypothetical protein LBF90_07270, partial [Prevotellaceae bacterium]|nr:hypothetical protein [Prevotellaceae bacterium]